MNSDERPDLTRAALRASRSTRLIGSLLPAWERAFGQTPSAYLAVGAASLTALSLCTRPRPDNWAADIAELEAACGIEAARLSGFLRQALNVEALASAPAVGDLVDGRLMAARDRTEDET
ncbi:hypothetical protein QA633_40085 [Bradyrhizobium barranii]|uniref:hypothetical protein n=1 Tax=Bradyrhizobium barranii TaxID=2992140 RepID=UPI0024AFBDD8|nr:hypothetical protein [Bradyrhizobium barranii]WFT94391.1 hypothetical protein QA633_40085 [Bradyrhizobium barranii]